ncbi:lysophospholipid acyltransferase LPEAT2 [Selaginella moellendorffii]|uniref:lysophospholipid acyltransferase LPEAT2 n=1 Tax=Selaginella moellendorffii TaxID=88036 RepID=UPI000D1CD9F6|nr:lysophospholipid acyltransferase LPEAT2 [Selaginella moellendorffii]|eukprot:XP_024529188.1 lysophospholipid acyltransferase LPEAT2 [Selaginella moellendorffii]
MAQDRQRDAADAFPLGKRPPIGPEAVVNPFQGESLGFSPSEIFKTILMLPIFLLRLAILAAALILAYCSVRCALIGVEDPLYKPFSRWRRILLWPLRICARIAMFAFGYVWISIKGTPAPRDVAPIVVSNHVSFLDPVYIFFSHMPVILSAKENAKLPIVGLFLTALQIIPVDRAIRRSRRDAAAQIRRRAIDNKWPHVLIFPEGTTTNGKALISFKTGAFAQGLPIQPMCIRYPHKCISPAWVNRSMPYVMFRLMTQLVNFMEVQYLPVVEPGLRDLKDPRHFTETVRHMMAASLGVPCTEHTFLDMKLAVMAKKLHLPPEQLPELSRMEKLFHIDYETAEAYLKKFSAMDTTHSGLLHIVDFLKALDLPLTPYTMQVFQMFDTSEKNYVNFREFMAGLAFVSTHTAFSSTIEAAFYACDQDKDGFLSRKEVEQALVQTFPSLGAIQIEHLFNSLDMDHDGVISWAEFKKFLQMNPEYLAVILAAYPNLLKAPVN